MAWKDRKEVASSLRSIYTAPTEEAGLMALAEFEETWGRKYPHVVLSWKLSATAPMSPLGAQLMAPRSARLMEPFCDHVMEPGQR